MSNLLVVDENYPDLITIPSYPTRYILKGSLLNTNGGIRIELPNLEVVEGSIQAQGDLIAHSNLTADLVHVSGNIVIGYSGDVTVGFLRASYLEAKGYIAARRIQAGYICSGKSIIAPVGIRTERFISCAGILRSPRVMAGACPSPTPLKDEDKRITCSKFEGEEVLLGTLIETGELEYLTYEGREYHIPSEVKAQVEALLGEPAPPF